MNTQKQATPNKTSATQTHKTNSTPTPKTKPINTPTNTTPTSTPTTPTFSYSTPPTPTQLHHTANSSTNTTSTNSQQQRQPKGPDGSNGFLGRAIVRKLLGKEDLRVVIERRREEVEKAKESEKRIDRKRDRRTNSRPGSQASSRNSSRASSRDTSPSRWHDRNNTHSHHTPTFRPFDETARLAAGRLALIDEESTLSLTPPTTLSVRPTQSTTTITPTTPIPVPSRVGRAWKRDSSDSGGSGSVDSEKERIPRDWRERRQKDGSGSIGLSPVVGPAPTKDTRRGSDAGTSDEIDDCDDQDKEFPIPLGPFTIPAIAQNVPQVVQMSPSYYLASQQSLDHNNNNNNNITDNATETNNTKDEPDPKSVEDQQLELCSQVEAVLSAFGDKEYANPYADFWTEMEPPQHNSEDNANPTTNRTVSAGTGAKDAVVRVHTKHHHNHHNHHHSHHHHHQQHFPRTVPHPRHHQPHFQPSHHPQFHPHPQYHPQAIPPPPHHLQHPQPIPYMISPFPTGPYLPHTHTHTRPPVVPIIYPQHAFFPGPSPHRVPHH